MTQKIAFQIKNFFDYNIDLFIEPFGVPFEMKPQEVFKVIFKSIDKQDITDNISIICKNKMIEIRIEGGNVSFELFQENEVIIQLEL